VQEVAWKASIALDMPTVNQISAICVGSKCRQVREGDIVDDLHPPAPYAP